MEIIDSKERVAKKEHICKWCGGLIRAGENYDWSKNKDNGKLYEWKSHIRCTAIAHHYDFFNYCEDDGLTGEDFKIALDEVFEHQFTSAEKAKLLYDKMEFYQVMESETVEAPDKED